jgi:glucose/sorbosone dehydrogenase
MPRFLTRPLVVFTVLAALLCLGAEAAPPIRLVPVVSGLTQPVYVTSARDGTDRLFVVEQGGAIKVLGPGQTSPRIFLDITAKVLSGGERGLLGLAFHPQIEPGRRFYVSYTRQPDGAVVIAEYRVSTQDANVADTAEKEVLVIPHPFENHNGGMLEFGPDDFLYISLGDGGDAFDPDNRAQDINQLMGKILRIDVDTPNDTQPYSSPSTNPFVGRDGANEIWVYGLRNPWRFSFDRETGELYVGDVGQDGTEEIDILNGGDNAGWRVFEASQCTNVDGCDSSGYVFPITEYSHNVGRCSVTGGYVYRGRRASLPFGSYVYGDYCSGEIFVLENGANSVALDTTFWISSFGEDEAGEILVVDRRGGAVYRIAAVAPAAPPQLTLAYDGKARDRVGAGNTALSADGALDATLTLTVSGVAGRAVTGLRLQSSAPGTWDTSSGTGYWVLGMARGPDDTLMNQAGTMAISVVPGEGDSFTLFASDAQNRYFGAGRTLTVTATFSGGATATARTTVPASVTGPPPPQQPPPQVTFDFIGMQRDRVGAGNTALSPDGAMDGTFVMSVSGAAGRALTALRLQSSAPGMWDTSSGTGYWVLGITRGPDDPLLNQAGTMALSVSPGDGEAFHLFAADYQNKEFLQGRTLTLTATFTGGVTVTATIVP